MPSSQFSTTARILVWPTTDIVATAQAPAFRFHGRDIDMDYRVELTPDRQSIDLSLWNIGRSVDVQEFFKKDRILALELARLDGPLAGLEKVPTRVALGRIKAARNERDSNTGDVETKISVKPLSEMLREIELDIQYPRADRPYKLSTIIPDMLARAGFAAHNLRLTVDGTVRNFTARGMVFSEIRRLAAKAGISVAIWTEGGNIIVSDHFVQGRVITQDLIFDAKPEEENDSLSSPTPLPDVDAPTPGEAYDLATEYAEAAKEEANQIQSAVTPTSGRFIVETPLLPEVTQYQVLRIRGSEALSEMGIPNARELDFNVLGVSHTGSTRADGDLDMSKFLLSTRGGDTA